MSVPDYCTISKSNNISSLDIHRDKWKIVSFTKETYINFGYPDKPVCFCLNQNEKTIYIVEWIEEMDADNDGKEVQGCAVI